jgi:hypothetical protein
MFLSIMLLILCSTNGAFILGISGQQLELFLNNVATYLTKLVWHLAAALFFVNERCRLFLVDAHVSLCFHINGNKPNTYGLFLYLRSLVILVTKFSQLLIYREAF